ncbi:site-specific DNA-methyltransferase [Methanobrevibacter sp.]|uniref:site-specific DNA-methyltransferase n=1 Tax=Methanobrevibacter sp. TaxID=66852 RepID=UPI003868F662
MKLNGESFDFVEDNIQKLKDLFPEIVTGDNEINFDYLRDLLVKSDETVIDDGEEHYNFTWWGKKEAKRVAKETITKTLRPSIKDSKNWDSTENIYIEGDNLDALKILLKSYRNRIKMIYIDPPYNTGHDFVYKDNLHETTKEHLESTGQLNEEGFLFENAKTDGKFHSNWLNMMYPRLILAKKLLTDDGVIFISIDDNEVVNLRKICDEIFGEENFINCIAVKMSEPSGVKMQHENYRFPKIKEYLLLYSKNNFSGFVKIDKYFVKEWDKENNLILRNFSKDDRDVLKEIENKSEKTDEDLQIVQKIFNKVKVETITNFIKKENIKKENLNDWKFDNSYRIFKTAGSSSLFNLVKTFDEIPNSDLAVAKSPNGVMFYYITKFNRNTKQPRLQVIFADENMYKNPCDFWQDIKTTGGIALEGGVKFTNGKKPLKLLKRAISMTTEKDDIILDFFAGSSSTAHAVMDLNNSDSNKRRFIMMQLNSDLVKSFNEATDSNTKKSLKESIDFLKEINKPLILSELGKERIRRSGDKIVEETGNKDLDIGFKVFKVDESNFIPWNSDLNSDTIEQAIISTGNELVEGRSELDFIYELLLKRNLDLNCPIDEKEVNGHKVYVVDNGGLLVCLESNIDETIASDLIDLKDELFIEKSEVILRDKALNDTSSINIYEKLKTNNIDFNTI